MISQPNVAARKIERIGYERLRIYFLSRRQLAVANRPFLPGTTYQAILRLYECDALLRDACFTAVGKFELLLRNSLSEALSQAHGSHPYDIVGAFRDAKARIEALKSFVSVYQDSKDQRAKHYRETYSTPVLPAIWTMKEFLTFGAASRIYQQLDGALRTTIAVQFGVASDKVFTNWVECFVDLRNICAHHGRLFNRSFQKQPSTLHAVHLPTAPAHKLRAVLQCLDHVLTSRDVSIGIANRVRIIIGRYPEMAPAEAGY